MPVRLTHYRTRSSPTLPESSNVDRELRSGPKVGWAPKYHCVSIQLQLTGPQMHTPAYIVVLSVCQWATDVHTKPGRNTVFTAPNHGPADGIFTRQPHRNQEHTWSLPRGMTK
jgi:hypothetical protein